MNEYFQDARVASAEVDIFNAERAERRSDFVEARALYLRAAKSLVPVLLGIGRDFPNTRSDLAIAAVVAFARGGDRASAVRLVDRVLSEPGLLTPGGRSELELLRRDFAPLEPPAQPSHASRGAACRDLVRGAFRRPDAA